MSYTYHLLCVDTLEVLDLGKFACLDEMGMPVPWRATGWLDQSDGHRVQGDELRRVVERFLVLHRGKELRVVPGEFLNEIDPTGEALRRIDAFSEVMEQLVNPEPDTNDELRAIPFEVTDRLKRACAQRAVSGG